MKDTQRKAVYTWEDTLIKVFKLRKPLTLLECQQMVNDLWARYEGAGQPPKVTDGRARRSACYTFHRIKLPKACRHPLCVMHETAHGLLYSALRFNKISWHGREFARLVLTMYSKEFKIDVGKLRSIGMHQRPRRVRFSTLKQLRAARKFKTYRVS